MSWYFVAMVLMLPVNSIMPARNAVNTCGLLVLPAAIAALNPT